MSSYISNLLTTTTSRYNSLRRTLLSDEADGDTEDDSHISRVLRAYYTEKGRPFPPWLPPDPKAPQQAPTQFVSSVVGRQPGQPAMGRGGGLSDLWDPPQQQQQPLQQEPVSLRRAQGRGGGRGLQSRPGIVESYSEPQAQGRPLPSQRAGSYQSAHPSFGRPPAEPSPPASSGSGATAQERLKARLWGSGRSNSPTPSSGNNSLAQTPSVAQAGMRNPYERSNSGNSNPSAGRPSAPYPDDRSGYTARGGAGRREQSPYTSVNSPWSNPDDGYGGGAYDSGGYGGQRSGGRERVGLPSGPRPR
ncbi:hypothetical protein K432DRAFT_385190 [Lepidopterella palustris CBS 459.81]|uniref:Mso1 N-terminal domain-containing protein n=1 Tax=Lepidopterella palustris CBS 459.81 TaxID=1314670 RepID=A0A8E2E3Z0_9PEZI|nr:hypothetical protein K432DRAFT_385190 [Lepidopterella palustris CBS 459.81]